MSEAEDPHVGKAQAPRPPHLIDLADGWTTWRTFCLRGAGFPVDLLEDLVAPQAAREVDVFLQGEAAVAQLRSAVLDHLGELGQSATGNRLRTLRRLRRLVSKGRSPDSSPDIPELSSQLAELAQAEESLRAAGRAARSAFEAASGDAAEALRDRARDDRFREAVAWQNRKVLDNSLGPLLRASPDQRNAQSRRHEHLVASYLQRYCAKNETIGFFGPVGWGRWSEAGATLQQRPGKALITARRTDFEYWAIAALAETLSTTAELRPWLAPRLDGRLRIENGRLVEADGRSRTLQPGAALILAACDGTTAARDLAAGLAARSDNPVQVEAEVYSILEMAAERDLVIWTLEVPVGPAPEVALAAILARIGDEDLRARLSAPLQELVAARDAVAAAAGNAGALEAALEQLETTFSRLTGRSAYHHQGRVYAGRTLVYEDCRRDTEFEVGPDLRQRVGPPLALILQSARWFSHSIAERFERQLRQNFAELASRHAPEPVPLTALEFLFDRDCPVVPGIVAEVAGELTAKWEAILLSEPGGRRVALTSDALRHVVEENFAAPGPGWPGARHHSADILVAVEKDPQGTAGYYLCVLGEVHVTDTMLMRKFFREIYEKPEELVAAYRRDVEQAQIYRVTAKDYQGHRKLWDPLIAGDLQLSRDGSPPWRSGDEVLRLADLVIEDSPEGLIVRSRDRSRRFPAMTYFERLLWRESFTEFALLPPLPHTPQIRIDNVVVRRESWRFLCSDLLFAAEKDEAERFIAARRWAHRFGLPRWVFVRPPQEYKPVYVDFDSPVSVEILAKMVRRAVEVVGDAAVLSVSEMLPTPEQSWLTDAAGNLYTSELRIVAVDPVAWHPRLSFGGGVVKG